MSEEDSGTSWSDIAMWYDDLITAGSGPHETAIDCLLRLVPPLEGREVLDIACGQGLATRALAHAGARHVVGIDASEEMVELARGHSPGQNAYVSYRHDDAEILATLDDASFDGATCQLGLMDIPDLAAAIRAVHRVLKPGGWFVFVIGHPCFLAPGASAMIGSDGRPRVSITGYFDERFWRSANPNGVRRAGNHHRMLSTYLNALTQSGFLVDVVEEPKASSLLAERQPLYREVPIFFAARTLKTRPRAYHRLHAGVAELVIRPYRLEETAAIRNLHEVALRHAGAFAEGPLGQRWDTDLDDIPASYLAGGGQFLVGEVDGRVVAMGALLRLDERRGQIKRMRVSPDQQRRGYGRAILARLEEFAVARGLQTLVLDTAPVQHAARALYASAGYVEVARGQRNGFDLIFMEKTLPAT